VRLITIMLPDDGRKYHPVSNQRTWRKKGSASSSLSDLTTEKMKSEESPERKRNTPKPKSKPAPLMPWSTVASVRLVS